MICKEYEKNQLNKKKIKKIFLIKIFEIKILKQIRNNQKACTYLKSIHYNLQI